MGEEMRRVSMKELLKKRIAGEQRGAFIVFTALAVWGLLMFVAFAVDFGNYYQHRTRLQTAADAAALAGVAQYADSELIGYTMSEKGKGRLVKLPTSITGGEAGKSATFSADDYTFTKLDKVPTEVHAQGQNYVQKNYRSDLDIKEDSMWSATQESTSSTTTQAAGGTTQITTTTSSSRQFCYRVDLEDKVTTFFARIFGVNELTVNVSAMAMLDGATNSTVEELLPMVSDRINDIIPNYYWESIANYVTKITDTSGNEVGTTAAPDPSDPKKSSNEKYGKDNINYLVSDANFDYRNVKWGAPDNIIGFEDSADGICAVPIPAKEPVDASNVITQVFNFTNDGSVLWHDQEIIGLFLDRDNIYKKTQITNEEDKQYFYDDESGNQIRFGLRDRFVEINLGIIHGKYDKKAKKYPQNPRPIFARLESEPVQISNITRTFNGIRIPWAGLTSVCGITIHVRLNEVDYENEGHFIKPFVFAYDGPDPNRGINDAPWIAQESVDLDYNSDNKNDYHLSAGRIDYNVEPLYAIYEAFGRTDKIPEQMVQSSRTTPGPIVLDIPGNTVFKGVIWAPRSKVIIRGRGKIIGFIAARRIDDTQYLGPHTFIQSKEISLPTLAAYRPAYTTMHDWFDYTKDYITDNYNMVYTDFVDYTRQ